MSKKASAWSRLVAGVAVIALVMGLLPLAPARTVLAEEVVEVAEEVDGEREAQAGRPDGDDDIVVLDGEDVLDELRQIVEEDMVADSGAKDVGLETQSVSVAAPRVMADSSMESGQRVTWDCVWLGSYPQAFVTDAATVAALDAATGWSAAGDLAYGGATYRRLREADATYSSTDSSYWQWSRASAADYCYFL